MSVFGAFANSIPDALLVTGLDHRIVQVNHAHRALYGFDEEELVGNHPNMFNPDGAHPQRQLGIDGALADGEGWSGELQQRHKSGRVFWVEMRIFAVVNERGQTVRYASTARDITARMHTARAEQAQVRQVQAQQDQARRSQMSRAQQTSDHRLHNTLQRLLGAIHMREKSSCDHCDCDDLDWVQGWIHVLAHVERLDQASDDIDLSFAVELTARMRGCAVRARWSGDTVKASAEVARDATLILLELVRCRGALTAIGAEVSVGSVRLYVSCENTGVSEVAEALAESQGWTILNDGGRINLEIPVGQVRLVGPATTPIVAP